VAVVHPRGHGDVSAARGSMALSRGPSEAGASVCAMRSGRRWFLGRRTGDGKGKAERVWGKVLPTVLAALWATFCVSCVAALGVRITRGNLARCVDPAGDSRRGIEAIAGEIRCLLEANVWTVEGSGYAIRPSDVPRETVLERWVALPLAPDGGVERGSHE